MPESSFRWDVRFRNKHGKVFETPSNIALCDTVRTCMCNCELERKVSCLSIVGRVGLPSHKERRFGVGKDYVWVVFQTLDFEAYSG